MDATAKEAWGGVGTLYRHFPCKEDLLAALPAFHHEARAIVALGDWIRAYEGLLEPLRAAYRVNFPLTPTCRAVIATTKVILTSARRYGFARGALTARHSSLGSGYCLGRLRHGYR